MRLRTYLLSILFSCFIQTGFCQAYTTKTSFIGFYSKTPFEDIEAENNQVYAVLDPASHHIAFALLMKGFIFPRELMQEHFNENYAESDKFPRASFSGNCTGDMDLTKEGIYQIVIKGDLTLHGITRPIETTGLLEVKNDRILGSSAFKIKPEDFQISIPGIVRDKIAKEINVKIQTIWTRTK
jgi:polyisoprenoid-binding protein YceI